VAAALGWRLVTAALLFGALDLVWQRHRHRQALRMTRHEVERERRQHEGDPRLRAERQRLHRAGLAQPPLDVVRQASFVIVGHHQAVALRYDRDDRSSAPVVLARGERLVAARLQELARQAGVPSFFDPGLAAALFAVEEEAEIPVALYEPVAQIVKVMLEGSPA
jgi:flagellar biosynthesis protein FlhB